MKIDRDSDKEDLRKIYGISQYYDQQQYETSY